MVECSFITEFEDHIFVTVDADAFFFLHDLISSYIKEKDRVVHLTEFLDKTKERITKEKSFFFSLEHKMYDPHHRIQIWPTKLPLRIPHSLRTPILAPKIYNRK